MTCEREVSCSAGFGWCCVVCRVCMWNVESGMGWDRMDAHIARVFFIRIQYSTGIDTHSKDFTHTHHDDNDS